MLLNDLAETLRAGGVNVHETEDWVGRNHGHLTSVECIVIHHTAGPATGDYPSLNTVMNGRSDLAGPLAQLGVGRSGAVYVISNGLAWHAGATKEPWQDNYHAIGIEVESTGTGVVWPDVQVQSTAKAVAALCRKYGVPVSRVLGHKEICYPVGRKIDPVGIPGDMAAFRALVQKYINNPSGDEFLMALTAAEQDDVLYASRNLARYIADTNQRIETLRAGVERLRPELVQLEGDPRVYITDGVGVFYRHVRNSLELASLLNKGAAPTKVVKTQAELDAYGVFVADTTTD